MIQLLLEKIRKRHKKTQEEEKSYKKSRVYATKQGALYIKVEELFAQKKVQKIVAKAMKIKVVGYK